MAANPKNVFSAAGRFCNACGVALGEGTRCDECEGCRAHLRRLSKQTPGWVMKRRMKVCIWERRMSLLLGGNGDIDRAPSKLKPLSKPHLPSELKAPTRPSLRVIRSKR